MGENIVVKYRREYSPPKSKNIFVEYREIKKLFYSLLGDGIGVLKSYLWQDFLHESADEMAENLAQPY